ncbi:hypothetical protein VE04_01438 [Pseudogymnoascus sp. 24MN13]|nr:hypothetical protein VE04_01438 [Pseudogymnoascus sp. 24MN13]
MSVTQRSDEELDREWKPSGRRPQSTMARHFSITLDDLFKIDNSIADLDAAVDQKKRLVSTHTSELKALEEALRATEERLKATAALPDHDNTLNAPNTAERPKTASRPGTARKPVPSPTQNTNLPPMPGARPPTPGASESESDESKEE